MRNVILISAALLLLTACGKKESHKNLQISGNIDGLKKGTLLFKKLKDSSLVTVDSIVINGDSKFQSEIDLDSPQMLYLVLDRGVTSSIDNSLMFFAEPGEMTIDTKLESFYSKAKITGSKNQELYDEFKKVKSRYTDRQLELSVAKFNAMKAGKPYSDEQIKKEGDDLLKKKYLYAINFAVNHKDNEIAPYIALSEISDANLKYLDTIRKILPPNIANSKYGKMLDAHIAARRKLDNVQ
ncbi:MAG: DUF4369 domain-containing protein [Flavobacterium sp.]|nr:MAG: DUF4369 domain-containing protein [Flavobacterium sp.]